MAEVIINARVPANKCQLIYHGFQPPDKKIEIKGWGLRKNQIIMISNCSRKTYYRKGIDQFLNLSHLMPEYDFLLIGAIDNDIKLYLQNQAPKNFRVLGYLHFNGENFVRILNESKFILQMSFYESFGCSVIDAAHLGCYPITTSNYSLLEVTYGVGSVCKYGDLNAFKNEIETIDRSSVDPNETLKKAQSKFPYDTRESLLIKTISGEL